MPDSPGLGPIGVRRVAAAIAGSALGFLASWLSLQNLRQVNPWQGWIFWVPITLLIFTLSGLCWWFALRGHQTESQARIWKSWRAARLLGGIGLVGGVVGPALIWPGSNQGPLLGILITGPLGFILGAVGGLLFPLDHLASREQRGS